ncbi:hypothetical protein [Ochrobactrum teleogrylli]
MGRSNPYIALIGASSSGVRAIVCPVGDVEQNGRTVPGEDRQHDKGNGHRSPQHEDRRSDFQQHRSQDAEGRIWTDLSVPYRHRINDRGVDSHRSILHEVGVIKVQKPISLVLPETSQVFCDRNIVGEIIDADRHSLIVKPFLKRAVFLKPHLRICFALRVDDLGLYRGIIKK